MEKIFYNFNTVRLFYLYRKIFFNKLKLYRTLFYMGIKKTKFKNLKGT